MGEIVMFAVCWYSEYIESAGTASLRFLIGDATRNIMHTVTVICSDAEFALPMRFSGVMADAYCSSGSNCDSQNKILANK